LVVTIAGVGTHLGHKWWVSRLDYLVEKYNRLIDQKKYARAGEVSDLAARLYPDSPNTQFMARQIEMIRFVVKYQWRRETDSPGTDRME
jgi:hypothetical protein